MNGFNKDELGFYTRPKSLTKVHFLNPRPCEIKLDDICYHLARSGRFNNGIEPHYSVAEHSVIMANYWLQRLHPETHNLSDDEVRELARQSLGHDTNEYLFGDIPATIKKMLPDYEKWEKPFEKFMLKLIGLPENLDPRIKILDKRMCSTEQLILRGHEPDTYIEEGTIEQYITFQLWDWKTAELEFKLLFTLLFPDYRDAEE